METKGYVDGVRICTINPEAKMGKRGRTGIRGITYKTKRGAYVVSIGLKGKMIYIGQFKNLDDAIKARKDAEEKYYKPLIERYDGPIGKSKIRKLENSNVVDLTGKQYPHFKVVKYGGTSKNRTRRWICHCECGKTFIATSSDIRNHRVQSCGCVKEEIPRITKPIIQCHCIMADGTNLTVIAKKSPNKNNKSGTKGIYQDRCGTWYAKIVFRGVEHRIKCTSQLQAIYKRKELEMEYFDPVVKEHKKLLLKKKIKKGK